MKPKTPTKHPYAATEHRVIDSPAYADLSFSARSLLVLITRQLTKDNNGNLQATFSYMSRFGFDSEHTLSRGIKELIAHGMIYRSRSGGYQQGAAKYAVTWLTILNRTGLFMDGFKPCAWRDWQPAEKKSPPSKMQDTDCKNGIRTPPATAKNAASHPPKRADIELMPCRGVFSGVTAQVKLNRRGRVHRTSPLTIQINTTADRGRSRLTH
jgi:hypothetical protein